MKTVVDRPDPDALLKPGEVALLFSVTPKTVTRWAESGKLPFVRTLGGHRRFPARPVMRLRAQLGPRPPRPARPSRPARPKPARTAATTAKARPRRRR